MVPSDGSCTFSPHPQNRRPVFSAGRVATLRAAPHPVVGSSTLRREWGYTGLKSVPPSSIHMEAQNGTLLRNRVFTHVSVQDVEMR